MASNAGILLTGSLASNAMAIASMAICARTLEIEQFGTLTVVSSWFLIIDKVCNFQSWQAVTKYSLDYKTGKQPSRLNDLYNFGFTLDGASALVSFGLCLLLLLLLPDVLPDHPYTTNVGFLLAPAILLRVVGTPMAILRTNGKFRQIATINASCAFMRLALFSLVAVLWDSIQSFAIAWAVSEITQSLLLLGLSLRNIDNEFRFTPNVRALRRYLATQPGALRFFLTSNVHSSIKLGQKELDIILIAVTMNETAAGSLKIVKTLGQSIVKLIDPLYQSSYPELASLASQKRTGLLVKSVRQSIAYLAPISVALVAAYYLFGKLLIDALFGNAFISLHVASAIYLLGSGIAVSTTLLQPALLALGHPERSIRILTVATLAYLTAFLLLTQSFGIVGASISHVLFYTIWAALMYVALQELTSKKYIPNAIST